MTKAGPRPWGSCDQAHRAHLFLNPKAPCLGECVCVGGGFMNAVCKGIMQYWKETALLLAGE